MCGSEDFDVVEVVRADEVGRWMERERERESNKCP